MKRILSILVAIQLCALGLCGCAATTPAAPAAPASPAAPAATAEPAPTPIPYGYISAQELYALLQEDAGAVLLLDLQPEDYYSSFGHLQGSVSTKAYPANDEKLLSALDAALDSAEAADTVVLIDMAGKAGAHNAFDHLSASGVDASKLRILEGGMMSWVYPDMVEIEPEAYTYQLISARDVRRALRNDEKLTLLDLRQSADYELSHIIESVNVPAAAISDDNALARASLAKALPLIAQDETSNIVILTADGGADAAMYYDYFAHHAIEPSRLFILENGINGWPEDYSRYIVTPEGSSSEAIVSKPASSEAPAETTVEAVPESVASEAPSTDVQYYG